MKGAGERSQSCFAAHAQNPTSIQHIHIPPPVPPELPCAGHEASGMSCSLKSILPELEQPRNNSLLLSDLCWRPAKRSLEDDSDIPSSPWAFLLCQPSSQVALLGSSVASSQKSLEENSRKCLLRKNKVKLECFHSPVRILEKMSLLQEENQ